MGVASPDVEAEKHSNVSQVNKKRCKLRCLPEMRVEVVAIGDRILSEMAVEAERGKRRSSNSRLTRGVARFFK